MGLFDKFRKQPKPPVQEDIEVPSAGWEAITARFELLYPGQTNPKHYATLVRWRFGGNDPLDGISVYDGGDFWHFVTYGLTELYEKESLDDDWEYSGFGFELTAKLKKLPTTGETEILGICGILQSLARYVFESKKCIAPYEYIYSGQTVGIDPKGSCKLTGFATLPDDAGIIDTANGKVEFVCVVGMTDRELRSIVDKERTTKEVMDMYGSDLTDYSRIDIF
jgi:hypothetical protein